MAFGSHLSVRINWSSSSASYESKLYYKNTNGAITLDNATQVADFINAKIRTSLLAVIPPYVTLNPLVIRQEGGTEDIEDTSTEQSMGGTYAGQLTGPGLEDDVLPEGDQVVIQFRTGLAGRSKRGRVFLPFVPEEFVDNSGLNALGLPKYKAVATKFSQEINMEDLGTLTPCRRDYKNGVLVDVTHCRVVSEICTRRDRRAPRRPVYFRAPAV